ncbi:MAG: DNA cytosine methyltransferase, partial [Lachnospiraceae bacterium]|nr:DNA cytosine methyltransferase [Lachnospiraceae bacterium]
NATVEGRSQPCIADNQAGTSGERHGSNQPRLGGMADGIPEGMDGHLIWKEEPKDVPRVTEYTKNRAHRLKVLGNAVCPQQVFPLLKYIADIETGACIENCVLCNGECLEK